MGLLSAREAAGLDPAVVDRRFIGIFAGRACMNVNLIRKMGDRVPGSTGDAIERQMLGGLNSGLANAPTRRRYPFVLVHLPITAIRAVRGLRAARAANERRWQQAVASPPSTLEGAQALLRAAKYRFESTMVVHLQNTMIAQALYDRTSAPTMTEDDHADRSALSTGYGEMEETAVVEDILEAGPRFADHGDVPEPPRLPRTARRRHHQPLLARGSRPHPQHDRALSRGSRRALTS